MFMQVALADHAPVIRLSQQAITAFNYSNITLCFLLLATWGFCLTATIQLTEGLLVGKTRDLAAKENAMEQAELTKQLELKERDSEIYRLRNVELKESNDRIQEEKRISEELLLNILPAETAQELLSNGQASTRRYEQVTILFTDFVNFTSVAELVPAEELVAQIDRYFRAFDYITTKQGVEKIKTIGDAYMCAGGLPVVNDTHALDVVNAALEILAYMQADATPFFQLRIGIHTGHVVAGVVGRHKFQYDIWGDAVNVAARMEQSSEAGRINISGSTYALVKDHFECEHRGMIAAKNKGELDMYFVKGRKT
jgi:class 3 adenylate cyclase